MEHAFRLCAAEKCSQAMKQQLVLRALSPTTYHIEKPQECGHSRVTSGASFVGLGSPVGFSIPLGHGGAAPLIGSDELFLEAPLFDPCPVSAELRSSGGPPSTCDSHDAPGLGAPLKRLWKSVTARADGCFALCRRELRAAGRQGAPEKNEGGGAPIIYFDRCTLCGHLGQPHQARAKGAARSQVLEARRSIKLDNQHFLQKG